MLTFDGSVRSVAVHGGRAEFVVAGTHGCSRVGWSTLSGEARRRSVDCAARLPQSVERPGPFASTGEDGPCSMPVPVCCRCLRSPARRPISRDRDCGRRAAGRRRLRGPPERRRVHDLAPNGRGFTPQIDGRGDVLHDGENKRALRAGRTLALFVPRQAILRDLRRPPHRCIRGDSRVLDGRSAGCVDGSRRRRALRPRALLERRLVPGPADQRAVGPTCLARGRTLWARSPSAAFVPSGSRVRRTGRD